MINQEKNNPLNIFSETDMIIEFFDLDPMQVVWHGNYIKYFEIGRRTLLEKIGYGYSEMLKSGFAFPIVKLSVKYLEPLRLQDHVRIKAFLIEYENYLKIKYEIINIKTGVITTKGLSAQMAYDIKAGQSCFTCPGVLTEKIEMLNPINIEGAKL